MERNTIKTLVAVLSGILLHLVDDVLESVNGLHTCRVCLSRFPMKACQGF